MVVHAQLYKSVTHTSLKKAIKASMNRLHRSAVNKNIPQPHSIYQRQDKVSKHLQH